MRTIYDSDNTGVCEVVSIPDMRPIKLVCIRKFTALIDAAKIDAAKEVKSK
jgi:hypothetical protein